MPAWKDTPRSDPGLGWGSGDTVNRRCPEAALSPCPVRATLDVNRSGTRAMREHRTAGGPPASGIVTTKLLRSVQDAEEARSNGTLQKVI